MLAIERQHGPHAGPSGGKKGRGQAQCAVRLCKTRKNRFTTLHRRGSETHGKQAV
jgi:hypothetical protein